MEEHNGQNAQLEDDVSDHEEYQPLPPEEAVVARGRRVIHGEYTYQINRINLNGSL